MRKILSLLTLSVFLSLSSCSFFSQSDNNAKSESTAATSEKTTVEESTSKQDEYVKKMKIGSLPKTEFSIFDNFSKDGLVVLQESYNKLDLNTVISSEILSEDKYELRISVDGLLDMTEESYDSYPLIDNSYTLNEVGEKKIFIRNKENYKIISYQINIKDVDDFASSLVVDSSSMTDEEKKVLRTDTISSPEEKFKNLSLNYIYSY